MYTAFYGLREKPFVLSPDPRFLFLADSHREALAHLLYGLEQGEGFIVISGEVGTGKTTICRSLLERLGAETELAFLFNPSNNATELLQSICEEFGLPPERLSRRELLAQLNAFLLEKKAESKRVVLIIDEAQNLSAQTLEQVRLLSNLETSSSKLIQIILLGQPELDDKLDSDELRQLRQRISVRWSLQPLPFDDLRGYVAHRLRVAAGAGRVIFNDRALREIHRRSSGIPRLVNVLCDRALLAGYAAQVPVIGPKIVRAAATELPGVSRGASERALPRIAYWTAATAAIGLAALLGYGVASRQAGFLSMRGGNERAAVSVPLPAAESPDQVTLGVSIDLDAPPLIGVENWVGLPSDPAIVTRLTPSTTMAPDPSKDGEGAYLASLLAEQSPLEANWLAATAIVDAFGLEVPLLAPDPGLDPIALVSERLSVANLEATDLDALAAYDYPALLELVAADGVPRTVALMRLDMEMAELVGVHSGESLRVPIGALDALWDGRAFVVWRSFERLPAVVSLGSSGVGVEWLQASLYELGFYDGDTTGFFDMSTEAAVREFQHDRRLDGDGIAGPLTQMLLYGVLDHYAVPRLSDPATRESVDAGHGRIDESGFAREPASLLERAG
jgi:general secretion pathway protein A